MRWNYALLSAVAVAGASAAVAQSAGPHFNANVAEAPYAASVTVPSSCTTIYLPGSGAWGAGQAEKDDYGDTEAQTTVTIEKMKVELRKSGMDLSNIVMFRATLAPDPKRGNKVDMAGYSRAYRRYFGTAEQPNKPARATYEGRITVANLLVEIEAVAAGNCK